MSKKQFDHIEERIREAAENSEPPFDEQAWANMELRLNSNDKKRRFLFWWFTIAIIFIAGGAGYYFYNQSTFQQHNIVAKQQAAKTNESIKDTEKVTSARSGQDIKNTKDRPANMPVAGSKNDAAEFTSPDISAGGEKQPQANAPTRDKPAASIPGKKTAATVSVSGSKMKPAIKAPVSLTDESTATLNARTNKAVNIQNKKITGREKQKLSTKIVAADTGDDKATIDTERTDSTVSILKPNTSKTIAKVDKTIENLSTDTVVTTVNDSLKKSVAKKASPVRKKQQTNSTKLSKLYFLASVGGEVGSVKLFGFKNNPVTVKYGAGIGYQLTKKLSVQTGFYAGTKKYIAGPGDYKAKAGSYWEMVQIIKVDAACLVYDIPVSVRYNILQKPTTTFFASAGLSSYLMKKEDYYYHYIRSNMAHEGAYSYTGNKSLFSVLNFSTGIEKKISPVLSMLIEPSVSVPLSGVGDGSVRLFNTALQLSLKYQPFKSH